MANLFILHMRREEDRREAADEDPGIRQSQLVNWYLNEIQDEIEGEEELIRKRLIVERVIRHLVEKVNWCFFGFTHIKVFRI